MCSIFFEYKYIAFSDVAVFLQQFADDKSKKVLFNKFEFSKYKVLFLLFIQSSISESVAKKIRYIFFALSYLKVV